jgi:hypothetical protein
MLIERSLPSHDALRRWKASTRSVPATTARPCRAQKACEGEKAATFWIRQQVIRRLRIPNHRPTFRLRAEPGTSALIRLR